MFGMSFDNDLIIHTSLYNDKTMNIYEDGKRCIFDDNSNFEREITPLSLDQIKKLKQVLKDEKWDKIDNFTKSYISQIE